MQPSPETKFIFFYSKDCPIGNKMLNLLPDVEKKFGITIEKLEFSYNSTNLDLLLSFSESLERDCGYIAVPAFISLKTNNSICEERSLEEIEKFVKENL
ncbi:MAG: hypothetical protein QMD14_05805 [Candidatus Aenigmarchaeota archaeon]|nr:hypothetical protein [Candidatus Aenigmarchaeota archaeon]